jgi:hypothetical protein
MFKLRMSAAGVDCLQTGQAVSRGEITLDNGHGGGMGDERVIFISSRDGGDCRISLRGNREIPIEPVLSP